MRVDAAMCGCCHLPPELPCAGSAASHPGTGIGSVAWQVQQLLWAAERSVSSSAGSISGDNFDIPVIPQNLLRPVQSTAPSGPWLFPTPDQWMDDVRSSPQMAPAYTLDCLSLRGLPAGNAPFLHIIAAIQTCS